jgi:signal transduction histidine kinase
MDVFFFPYINAEKEIEGFVVDARDITTIKLAEEALQLNKKYLEKAQEISLLGSWKLDIIRNELIWTEENYKVFGVPLGTKLNYEIFINCVHPDDRDYVDRQWKAATAGGTYDIEHRVLVDGKVKWVREKAEMEFDDKGNCIGGVGFTQDITESKKAAMKLKDQQRILDQTGSMAQIGGWEHDLLTGGGMWTNALYEMIGLEFDEQVPGVNEYLSSYSPGDRKVLHKAYDDTVNTGKPFELELCCNTKKNTTIWVHIYGEPVMENDRCVLMRGTFQDITERKNTELELERISYEIRELSRHNLTAREEERKIIAREIHDELGQALTALKIDLSLLEDSVEKDPELSDQLCSIQKYSDNLIGTVNRIAADLRPAILDDFGLIAAIEWQLEEFCRKTSISCTVNLPQKEMLVAQDIASNVYRIVQESLTNIMRHAKANKVDFAFVVEKEQLIVVVEDNGMGIVKGEMEDHKSFGLIGMRERALCIGGTLTIISKKGSGTKVELVVPLDWSEKNDKSPHRR